MTTPANDSKSLLDAIKAAERPAEILLRYLLAGLAGLVTFGVLEKDGLTALKGGANKETFSVVAVLVYAIPIGACSYLISRAFFFPIIWWILARVCLREELNQSGKKISPAELDRRRTSQRIKLGEGATTRGQSSHLLHWAHQVHALYCITLAVVLTVTIHAIWRGQIDMGHKILAGIAVFLLFCAVNHHRRYLSEETSRLRSITADEDPALHAITTQMEGR